MKKNPFMPWGMPRTFMNRRIEQKLITNFFEQIANGNSWFLLIRGGCGSGKTTLLRFAKEEAEKEKFSVCFLKMYKNNDIKDLVNNLKVEINRIIREFEENGKIEKNAAESFIKTKSTELDWIIRTAKKLLKKELIIIIAQIDNCKKPQSIIDGMAKIVEREKGVGFIVSSTRRLRPPLGGMLTELEAIEEQDFREYIEKMTKSEQGIPKIGEECARVIYQESGGNPRLLQFLLWYLYENAHEGERIITKAHYISSKKAILSMLANEWFGALYADASPAEKSVLKQLALSGEATVTEIARATKKKEGPTATLLIRLLERGDVIKVRRGAYKLFAPLYASFIAEM